MKRSIFISVFVLLIVLLCGLASAETIIASGSCGSKASWTLDDSYNLKITGSGSMSDYNLTDNIAPWMAYKDQIKTVEIGGSVTNVGVYTFRDCTALTEAVFNDSVVKIGDYAFEMCKALAKADLPPKLTRIGHEAFSDCSLTQVNIPSTVSYIGVSAFEGNDFETLVYPSAASVSGGVFSGCEKLQKVIVPEGVTYIASQAFYKSTALTEVSLPATLKTIRHHAFYYCPLKELDVPASVTKIEEYAFYKSQITDLKLHDGIVEIGKNAFSYNKLNSIELPSTLTTLGEYAFAFNYDRTARNVIETLVVPGSISVVNMGVFYDTYFERIIVEEGVTTLCAYCFDSGQSNTQIDVPASVTTIEDGWYGGSHIIYTPNANTYAYQWGTEHSRYTVRLDAPFRFYDENGEIYITSYHGRDPVVNIPATIDGKPVTGIGPTMFGRNPLYGATPFVTKVQLPDVPLHIANAALWNLMDGCEVHIPDGVNSFETGCLGGGNHIIFTTTNSPAHKHWIGGDDYVTLILTDMNGSGPYTYKVSGSNCTITGYYSTEKVIEIPSQIDGYKVTAIGNGAFHGTCVQDVTIPASVTKIGDLAFCYVHEPSKFVARIPASVKTIGDTAFPYEEGAVLLVKKDSAAHTNLKKPYKKQIKLWDGENFSYEFFKHVLGPNESETIVLINGYWGTGRGDVTVPSKIEGKRVARLGGGNDYDIIDVVFPASRPFNNLIIPKTVEETCFTIEKGAIKNVYTPDLKYKFSTIWFSANQDTVFHVYPESDWHKFVEEEGYNYRFVNSYMKIQLPNALKNIQPEAFIGDGSLEYVVVPDSVKTIGQNAFKNCSNLQRVEINSMSTAIEDGAFDNCHADFAIMCKAGSNAEAYAQAKSIKYEIIQ